jgi:hypothetical protein
MVKNLREKVAWCQRSHPVTHYYDCADIVQKYLKLVKVRSLLACAVLCLGVCVGVCWVGSVWVCACVGRRWVGWMEGWPRPGAERIALLYCHHSHLVNHKTTITMTTTTTIITQQQDPLRGVRVPGAAGADE